MSSKATCIYLICLMLISLRSRSSFKVIFSNNPHSSTIHFKSSSFSSQSSFYSTSTALYARNIYQVSEDELTQYIVGLGQPKFRANQVKNWVYSKGAVDFEVMKDVPGFLRKSLSSEFVFGDLSIASEQLSKDGKKLTN